MNADTGNPRPIADMPYREKTAWLTLIAMLVTYAIYFAIAFTASPTPRPVETLWLFGQLTAVQAIIVGLGHVVLARRGYHAADERDKAIARRAGTTGYYVLLAGTIYVGVVLPFAYQGTALVNAALLAIVTAEVIRLSVSVSMIVASYRGGWHG